MDVVLTQCGRALLINKLYSIRNHTFWLQTIVTSARLAHNRDLRAGFRPGFDDHDCSGTASQVT